MMINNSVSPFDSSYPQYMYYIKDKYPDFYDVTRIIENILTNTSGIQIVLPYFKLIVPTIPPTDYQPYKLLLSAIVDYTHYNDYNRLCAFSYIAGFRAYQIEIAGNNYSLSEKGRDANKIDIKSQIKRKRQDAKILFPLFIQMHQEKEKFYKYYRNSILDFLLDYYVDYLNDTLDAIAKKHKVFQDDINCIVEYLNGIQIKMKSNKANELRQNIIKKLLKIKPLRKQIYDKYRRWRNPNRPKEFVLLDCLGDIPVSYLEATSWKKFPPFPIEKHLQVMSGSKHSDFDMDAFLKDIKNTPVIGIIDLTKYYSH